MRQGFAVITVPLQLLVDSPRHIVHSIRMFSDQKHTLMVENQKLSEQSLLLQAKLKQYVVEHRETQQLRKLLAFKNHNDSKMIVARVVVDVSNRSRQLLILNKGSRDGVAVGLPVADAYGIMGQIIDV